MGIFNFFKKKKAFDTADIVIGWMSLEASKLIGHEPHSKGYNSAVKSSQEHIAKFVIPAFKHASNKQIAQNILDELTSSCGKRAAEAFGTFCFLLWVRIANIQIAIAQGRVKQEEATTDVLINALLKQVKKVAQVPGDELSSKSSTKAIDVNPIKGTENFGAVGATRTGAEMVEEGLRQVAIAIKSGAIELQKGRFSDDIFVHADSPMGSPRVTYVMFNPLDKKEVISRCVFIFDRVRDGVPVFQMDWAVVPAFKGKRFGIKTATKAMTEFVGGMLPKSENGFFIEAVVDEGNEASIKIARNLIGNEEIIFNKATGANVYRYLAKIDA